MDYVSRLGIRSKNQPENRSGTHHGKPPNPSEAFNLVACFENLGVLILKSQLYMFQGLGDADEDLQVFLKSARLRLEASGCSLNRGERAYTFSLAIRPPLAKLFVLETRSGYRCSCCTLADQDSPCSHIILVLNFRWEVLIPFNNFQKITTDSQRDVGIKEFTRPEQWREILFT